MKTKIKHLKGIIKIKQDENRITVVASDETLDRHGDVLPIDQWDLSKFKKAPRMLVDHDHQVSSIVGKWLNPRIEGKELLMDADFHNITELSKAVQQMVKEGYLDTVSVGFIFHSPEGDGQRPVFELIETSWVTVPANPSARVQASLKSILEKQLNDEDASKVKEYIKKEELGDEGEAEDEEIDIEEEEEEIVPPVEPPAGEVLEVTPEKLTELGFTICENAEQVKEFQKEHAGGNMVTVCKSEFVLQLIADSEKLLTLTESGQASFQVRLLRESLKEAARMINQSLHKMNKVV